MRCGRRRRARLPRLPFCRSRSIRVIWKEWVRRRIVACCDATIKEEEGGSGNDEQSENKALFESTTMSGEVVLIIHRVIHTKQRSSPCCTWRSRSKGEEGPQISGLLRPWCEVYRMLRRRRSRLLSGLQAEETEEGTSADIRIIIINNIVRRSVLPHLRRHCPRVVRHSADKDKSRNEEASRRLRSISDFLPTTHHNL